MKNIPSIRVIKESHLDAVIHTKTKREAIMLVKILGVDEKRFYDERDFIECWDGHKENTCYRIRSGKVDQMDCIKFYQKINEEIYEFPDLFATGGVTGARVLSDLFTAWEQSRYSPEFMEKAIQKYDEVCRLKFKNGSSIEALPQKDDAVRGKNHFCDGFRGGKIPTPSKPVSIEEQLGLPKGVSIHDLPTSELLKKEFNVTWIDKIALPTATETKEMVERVRREIFKFTNAFPKEEEKMSTKFTFYVTEGTRVDKSCNGTIPTMTTTVVDASGKKATVTCDKADYSERQGVLEAIAQMACGGNFDKEYDKAVKKNKLIELHDRTCTYCGKVFDTVEELKVHEAWHVERKKARRERYLLRKRAKEIAFEEQAQKMAKEIIAEDNKK